MPDHTAKPCQRGIWRQVCLILNLMMVLLLGLIFLNQCFSYRTIQSQQRLLIFHKVLHRDKWKKRIYQVTSAHTESAKRSREKTELAKGVGPSLYSTRKWYQLVLHVGRQGTLFTRSGKGRGPTVSLLGKQCWWGCHSAVTQLLQERVRKPYAAKKKF